MVLCDPQFKVVIRCDWTTLAMLSSQRWPGIHVTHKRLCFRRQLIKILNKASQYLITYLQQVAKEKCSLSPKLKQEKALLYMRNENAWCLYFF